jgi:hypothetical protein
VRKREINEIFRREQREREKNAKSKPASKPKKEHITYINFLCEQHWCFRFRKRTNFQESDRERGEERERNKNVNKKHMNAGMRERGEQEPNSLSLANTRTFRLAKENEKLIGSFRSLQSYETKKKIYNFYFIAGS